MRQPPPLLLLLLAVPLLAVGDCRPPGPKPPPPPVPEDDGFVPESSFWGRKIAYLRYATEEHGNSPLNAIAHMERSRVEPGYQPPAGQVDVGAWQNDFDQIRYYEDTRDFGALYILNAYLGYGPSDADPDGHPYVTPAMWEQVEQALLSFKMWYTDATPAVPDPRDPDCADPPVLDDGVCPDWDNTFYWTENHQFLFHVIQYLSGQRWPDACFTQAGFTPTGTCDGTDANGRAYERFGWQQMEEARPRLERWMNDRWTLGYSEFHSNIYYQKDMTPLLTMVEFAEDEELARRAAILLDQILLELALHTEEDTFGVAAGRSAMKDKWQGTKNDTWGIAHLLFRQQDRFEFFSRGDAGATLFARAQKYRLPRMIHKVAHAPGPFVAKERHSLSIDESRDAPDAPLPFVGPFYGDPDYDPIRPDDDPNHGFAVRRLFPERAENRFTFWWGLGAWTAWQVVPLTVLTGDAFNMWNTELLRPFRPLREILGPIGEPVGSLGDAQSLALQLWPLATVGFLKEANTYTYQTPDYMLGTVHDYRKGVNVGQVHAWNLTIDPDAMVFTQHPMNAKQGPEEWIGADEGEPGYWTGSASSARSAQHENVGIHLYSPVYSDGGALGFFDYEAFTHAWVPRDAFDAVVQDGPWTFGEKDGVYFGLFSLRGTRWESYTQEQLDILGFGQSFDLVADGPMPPSFDDPSIAPMGPDNVWIVEVGTAAEWGSFAAFRAAIAAAPLEITAAPGPWPVHPSDETVRLQHFDVAYDSPSQGLLTFGWDADLTVRGEVVPIRDYKRFDNPWVQMERGDPDVLMQAGPYRVYHHWESATREVSRQP